jgi:hypothetical protein
VSKAYPDKKRPGEEKRSSATPSSLSRKANTSRWWAPTVRASTLVRMIMNEEPYEGEIRLGHNVIIGYYAQDMPERMNPHAP